MTSLVYMAGPITGCSYGECTDWRQYAKQKLLPIHGLSPMRGKEYLASIAKISGTGEEYAHMGPLSLPQGVMTRDRYDATRCDVLLVNLLGATTPSLGTVMEIAWADLKRIPIVCAMEAKGNPHEHMMINQAIGYRVETLDAAIHIVKAILTP